MKRATPRTELTPSTQLRRSMESATVHCWLPSLKSVVALCVVGAWLVPGARAQDLIRPPQPTAYTSLAPVEGLLNFPATAAAGEEPLSTVSASWAGMYQISTIRPPDPHGAAGPNGILQTVNLRVAYYTKTGTLIWGPTTLATFWAGVGNLGTGLSDPRALYDPSTGRFYVIMQENTTNNQAFLNLAVSKTSNPASSGAGDWYFYRLNITETIGATKYGADYPGLGFDGQAIYVTYNMYSFTGTGTLVSFNNCQVVVLDKAAVNGGTGTYFQVFTAAGSGNGFTLQPATVIGTNSPGNVAYFGETPLSASTSVRLWALSDPLGARTLTSTSVTVPDNGGFIGAGAPQSGTTTNIPTLSNRTQGNAFFNNGAIWFCHTAGGSSGKSIIYYYKINANSFPSGVPTLGESGGIDGGSGVWTYQVSIGANRRGDVALVYCQSSSSTFPTIMYTARTAAAGSFETPTVLKASPTFSNSTRWGDYASVTPDPADDTLWVTHEWSRSTASHDWGTWWGQVQLGAGVPVITVVATDATAGEPGSGQGTGTFTVSRTGPTTAPLTVNFRVTGTATAGSDYTALVSPVTIPIAAASTSLTVSVIDDALVEGDESVILTVTNGSGYAVGTPSNATVTIKDDDVFVTVVATDATAGEPGTGQGTGKFTVSRTGATTAPLTVNFRVTGTATAGSDYTALVSPITIPIAAASTSLTVSVIDDALVEGDESVTLTVTNGSGYAVGTPSNATVTIKDYVVCPAALVTNMTLGTLRNNFSGWVGMRLRVGARPFEVQSLGRIFVNGNAQSHELRLVAAVGGATVASVVWTPSGGVSNRILYVPLAADVTLAANADYYLVSQEVGGGDQWYDNNTTVMTTSVAGVPGSIYSSNGSTWTLPTGTAGHSYVPVSLQYCIAVCTPTALVTNMTLGTLRNNFSGWVGMRLRVGASPLEVQSLGRIFVNGNAQSHELRLVAAVGGATVASVVWTPSGGVANQILYVPLAADVTLAANTDYYLVSQEAVGGDQWYDNNTTVMTTSVAGVPGTIYSSNGSTWTLPTGTAGHTYVPVSLLYCATPVPQPVVTVLATDATAGEPGTGQGTGKFTVSRTGPTTSPLTVNFRVTGTATAGSDYTALLSPVTIPIAAASTSLTVNVIDDALVEGDESVTVTVTNGSGYAVGTPSNATVTIKDDDIAGCTPTALVTNMTLGTLRNNFSGWVGMRLRVGASPLEVQSLGRIFVNGNAQSHELRLVAAVGGATVASVVWTPSGGVANQILYVPLAADVTLAANTDYYLVSQEVGGGDQWYDNNTTVTTTSVAGVPGTIYSSNGSTWTLPTGTAGHTYVPVSLLYCGSGRVVAEAPANKVQLRSGTVGASSVPQISRIAMLEDGSVRLTVSGHGGQRVSLLASEDMTTWSVIGAATPTGEGPVEITDLDAGKFAHRVYRVVSLSSP